MIASGTNTDSSTPILPLPVPLPLPLPLTLTLTLALIDVQMWATGNARPVMWAKLAAAGYL